MKNLVTLLDQNPKLFIQNKSNKKRLSAIVYTHYKLKSISTDTGRKVMLCL